MNLQITQGSWGQLFARSHPIFVHLPIGILLLAMIMALLASKTRWHALRAAIPVTLLVGFISAVGSCLSGYLLSQDGGYEEKLLLTHQVLGISVAAASGLLYLLYRKPGRFARLQLPAVIVIGILLSITGHYGGSLTHGDDYLTQAMPGFLQKVMGAKTAAAKTAAYASIPDARLYEDLVQPILANKCYSCHNSQKLKGGLRLETIALIKKGGEHGPALKDSLPESSELFRRLLLPENDEHRMPPKGKPGITPPELALIQWWIEQGAPEHKQVKELPKTGMIAAVLEGLQGGADIEKNEFVPEEAVAAADRKAIDTLQSRGVKVMALGEGSNYLSVSCVNAADFGDSDVLLLLPLKQQLVWLDVSGTKISDSAMVNIAQLTKLTRLNMKQTRIAGKQLNALATCRQLKYLNISENDLQQGDIQALQENKSLQQLYLFGSNTNADKVKALKSRMTSLRIDTGDAALPKLASDTLVYHKVQG
ncbi:Uncharacterized membrane protein [Chitinophaga terrae (ex Kim and Jung 2007)]|uniref:Uncharacterized membrane protein n=1 Tax=Chitinophaga terrae (ex Kim and Jung 2007) TaxID=408074 RepID=A0A1H4APU3_9BACT|nr:c-type cytochrome domain-containing protein [Chitinophaga terrae (ex Kim and Jung 2007)]MDQ0106693.1 putative membrane protein [Chitinophaga terrae (ex Kim and Jung 2007)]GEP89208.1 hypothetical protein CTE07_08530 [Chitinophaga terrae (ex Kim and Jung 2007)]SEA37950.1 Uncharacterized membrane protein [Chitinophaga terrae (ex Kim and Jung 2007)]